MIGRLTGTVIDCSPGDLLLDVSGVGYALRIPLSTYYYVIQQTAGTSVSIHVHTHVREDTLQLYGFGAVDERTTFQRLITISGVGPRIALAILSGIGTSELRVAVAKKDSGRLQKIPGVGKKTAERLLLELRDKLDPARPGRVAANDSATDAAVASDAPESTRRDAISALTNLGYSDDQSERSVNRALEQLESGASLEQILKRSLRGLND